MAPSTVIAFLPSPLPNWWPTTPPSAPPATAPTPLALLSVIGSICVTAPTVFEGGAAATRTSDVVSLTGIGLATGAGLATCTGAGFGFATGAGAGVATGAGSGFATGAGVAATTGAGAATGATACAACAVWVALPPSCGPHALSSAAPPSTNVPIHKLQVLLEVMFTPVMPPAPLGECTVNLSGASQSQCFLGCPAGKYCTARASNDAVALRSRSTDGVTARHGWRSHDKSHGASDRHASACRL